MKRPKFKELYEQLLKNSNQKEEQYKNRIDRMEKEYEERDKKRSDAVDDLIKSYPCVYAHESFSEGFLADGLKYKITVTRPPKKEELEILIERLLLDKKILFGNL